MIQGMLSCPTDAQIRSDLQMLGGFCATLIWNKFTWSQMVHNMVTRRPATSLEKKERKVFAWVCFPFPSDASFLLGCTKTGERCRSSCNLKKQLEEENVPRCLDWPKQTCCHRQLCCLLWHDELGLFSTGSSLDPGSSCQKRALNQSNKLFFLASWASRNKPIHKASLKTDANTLAHT